MIDLFVINLIDCLQRKNQIIQDFSEYREIQLNFVEGIRHENGGIGCFLSFKKCIRMAKERDMKYIIILEDDCLPRNNFENRLKKVINYLESNLNNWNIFLGGVLKCNRIIDKKSYLDENFYYICRAHSAHLFICNSNIYDSLLEVDETQYAVDTFWHKRYEVCIFLPFLAYQRNGPSNIGKKYYGTLIDDYTRTEKYLINYLEKNINRIQVKENQVFINNINYINNKLYKWNDFNIKFLNNLKIDVFGKGYYNIIDNYNIEAIIQNNEYNIKFNNDYTEFISIRKDDSFIFYGYLLIIENTLINKTYKWEDSSIKFLYGLRMNAFGKGYYKIIDNYNIVAKFGKREHDIKFNHNYTDFISIRKGDLYIVNGKLLTKENATIENATIENTTIENVTIENATIENATIENATIENTTIENATIENNINNIKYIIKKKYKWNESYIKFLDYIRMDAFGRGYYKVIDNYNIIAYFGKRIHNIIFNNNYTEFKSTRKGDLCVVCGKIIIE